MAAKILVPELGESVLEATVGRWQKKEGDRVKAGDVLVSLETDKVDLEVGAERDGVLGRIERQEGEDVKIGDVLAVLEDASDGAGGESAAQGSVDRGQRPEREPMVAAGTVEPEPGSAGTSQVPESTPQTPDSNTVAARTLPAEPQGPEPMATPSARRRARERGVDLTRVTQEDVEKSGAAAHELPRPQPPTPVPVRSEASSPVVSLVPGNRAQLEERVRMSRRRQTIARRLVEAQHAAAMLTTFNEIDMGAVMELRQRQKEAFKKRYGVSLGITSFFVKASITALREFPKLNAEITGDEIVYKRYYDIGVAVGASEGLVVPVLRDADRMSFAEMETAVKDFAHRAEDHTLTLEDLRGGTFTITNGGVFGSLLSTPILNPPQVGILGLHKVQERPVSANGAVVTRPMMYVALSYDHRLVDGLEAVQFLVRIKQLMEDPGNLLIEG